MTYTMKDEEVLVPFMLNLESLLCVMICGVTLICATIQWINGIVNIMT